MCAKPNDCHTNLDVNIHGPISNGRPRIVRNSGVHIQLYIKYICMAKLNTSCGFTKGVSVDVSH